MAARCTAAKYHHAGPILEADILAFRRKSRAMATPEGTHIKNVQLVKDATTSNAGANGFDGRYIFPLGLVLLGTLAAIAYLFSA